ncbi:MAG: penicillin-binding protein activator, partial [Cellvibrionales bacterium]|nr:penicillin-binding protein activator [Cellvibrionales bacterium]
NHIAAINPPFELPAVTDPLSQQARKIALILPLSGPLSKAGIAVQDGVVAGYFNAKGHAWQPPKIISYDSHQQSIESIYQDIEREAIDLVIGPLQKNKLEQLVSLNPKVSVIALNYLTETTISNPSIIQFGLAAEDEARQLANNARHHGHKNAIIIQSNADWSRRAGLTFREQWAVLGGQTINHTALSEPKNYSSEIAESLLLPQSQARHKQLERLLATSIEFTPRRRNDVDVIILFANSEQAKSIKPLLAYHYASKLPVYSSSHIHDGVEGNSNRDLNGIIFNEIPWVLSDNAIKKKAHPQYKDNKQLGRLFAMGLDAFYLYPHLESMQQASKQVFFGKTGRLSINTNRINRELQLVQFNHGKIKPASSPRL